MIIMQKMQQTLNRSLGAGVDPEFISGMMDVLNDILLVAIALMGIYAVILTVNLARADDESKRRQAKERIVKVFASIFIILALLGMIKLFQWNTSYFGE